MRRFVAPTTFLSFRTYRRYRFTIFHFMAPTGLAILPLVPFLRLFYHFPIPGTLPGSPFSHFPTVLTHYWFYRFYHFIPPPHPVSPFSILPFFAHTIVLTTLAPRPD